MIRYSRKSVRQTFWIGMILMAAAAVWLVGSVAAKLSLKLSPDAIALVSVLPAVLLALGACAFLGAWMGHRTNQLFGIDGTDEDDPES
jgi:lipopolysaccharide export LptBFGC system permease protein LptF